MDNGELKIDNAYNRELIIHYQLSTISCQINCYLCSKVDMLIRNVFCAIIFSLLIACGNRSIEKTVESADMILINGVIATIDQKFSMVEALAIKGDRILATGDNDLIKTHIGDYTEIIDLKGAFAIPGFIEGHGHFLGLGNSLIQLNFMQTKSWQQVVDLVQEKVAKATVGSWIEGRGWHQEKWEGELENSVDGWPNHKLLSEISSNNPIVLKHASGHAIIANAKAMELANITDNTPNPSGGTIVRDENGKAIGVFEETAMNLITDLYNVYKNNLSRAKREQQLKQQIEEAQKACLKNGITSFQDAGASFKQLRHFEQLAESGELDIRLWAMISGDQKRLESGLKNYPVINAGNHHFTCRAIKSYMDGALGSFGAWLLEPYSDKPDFYGQNVTDLDTLNLVADLAAKYNLQHCVHAIGDRANRETLNIFERVFKSNSEKKNFRWRIEHAQHIHPDDVPRFKTLGVIASMQAVHCTSDAPFVPKRLGAERAKSTSYIWRTLLDNDIALANGTDTPVEDVNPLENFYASVTRKSKGESKSFFSKQRMSRKEALYSLTAGNAYAAFEENDKGILVIDKLADVTVLSNNLLLCEEADILETEVLYTIVGGEVKYKLEK